jgi:transcriptional regulator with XRE-family HTH domain
MMTKTTVVTSEMADVEVEEDGEQPDLLAEFGWRLAGLRRQNRWTREELAERLGVSRQRVGNWENGRHSPSIGMLSGLSRALKVTTDELIHGMARNPRQRTAEEWQAAVHNAKELTRFLDRWKPDPPLDEDTETI